MSDLEEENRYFSGSPGAAGESEDQNGTALEWNAESLYQARSRYEAIQIPGELNTRVRAAIELDRRRRKRNNCGLAGAGAAALFAVCCLMGQTGWLSKQKTEYKDPSRNVIGYPQTKEDVPVVQTLFGTETEVETETQTEAETETQTEAETEKTTPDSEKKREN